GVRRGAQDPHRPPADHDPGARRGARTPHPLRHDPPVPRHLRAGDAEGPAARRRDRSPTMTRQTLAVRTLVSVCLAVLPALVGCAGGGRSVSGHVLAGRASVVTVVAPDDARLSTPGVAGVTVRLTRGDGAATSLAE